jgi:tripartite-type tricarboxylate transporter receptor subunit TctC
VNQRKNLHGVYILRNIIGVIFICLTWTSDLSAQAPFYQGKQINIRVGFNAGGSFDVWARIIARHLEKHVPGNPSFIVQNMAGGGSIVAANYIYRVAKPDGLTLGMVSPGVYLQELAGQKEVQFEWFKYSWIGSAEESARLFYIRADAPFKALEDLRDAAAPVKCGSTGLGTGDYYFPRFLQEAFGLKLAMVPGYQSSPEANLAIERNEIQCRAGSVQAFFGTEPSKTWAKTGFVRPLAQSGRKRYPNLPDVPTIWELMDKHKVGDADRQLAKILVLPDDIGRPFFGPPAMPADRLKILRDAFAKMMSDPELIAETKKAGLDPSLTTGESITALGKELGSVSPDLVRRMKQVLEN